MSVAVAGATGMVGRAVAEVLRGRAVRAVSLSRLRGTELTTREGLDRRPPGATALIDVTNSPSQDEELGTAFFAASTAHLGAAASRHGLHRVILLSIIGVDRVPHGNCAAKLDQEKALREAFQDVVVLRSAQFHETPPSKCAYANLPILHAIARALHSTSERFRR